MGTGLALVNGPRHLDDVAVKGFPAGAQERLRVIRRAAALTRQSLSRRDAQSQDRGQCVPRCMDPHAAAGAGDGRVEQPPVE
jgi:hypothetical protein